MASYHTKTVDGHGPYLYKSYYVGGQQRWEHIGPVAEVGRGPSVVNTGAETTAVEPGVGGVTPGMIDDAALAALTSEMNDDDFRDLAESLMDVDGTAGDDDIIDLVYRHARHNTDDDEFKRAVRDLKTDSRSFSLDVSEEEAREAMDIVEDRLGYRPATVDKHGNRIRLIDDDIETPPDAETTAKLLNGLTASVQDTWSASDADQQRDVQDAFEDTLGADTVRKAKQAVEDPDALGFAAPSLIPATGDDDGRTAVTDIKGVGPATARDAHPDGEVMSIEDWGSLSKMQREHVRLDVDATDYAASKGELAVAGADDAGEAVNRLEGVLQMAASDRDGFRAADAENVVGIADSDDWAGDMLDEADTGSVESIDKSEEIVTVTTNTGEEATYSRDYFETVEPVIDKYSDSVVSGTVMQESSRFNESGEQRVPIPMKAELETGESIVLAPRVDN